MRLGAPPSQTFQVMRDLRAEVGADLVIRSFNVIVVSLFGASECVRYQFLLCDLGQVTISAHTSLICKIGT